MGLLACSAADEPTEVPGGSLETGETQQEFSHLGVERVIPLRVMQIKANLADPDHVSFSEILGQVARANQIFFRAGVQFYVSSYESLQMDRLEDADARQNPTWSQIRGNLQQAFPALTLNAWADGLPKDELVWMAAVNSVFGNKHEIPVWVHKSIVVNSDGDSANYARFPREGRAEVHVQTGLASFTTNLAHELGHTLGLAHTWQVGCPGNSNCVWQNPQDGTDSRYSDSWDLVYIPYSPPVAGNAFFPYNRAIAADNESSLERIQKKKDFCPNVPDFLLQYPADDGCCTEPDAATNKQRCFINGAILDPDTTEGASALKGLMIRHSSNEYASNVMAYFGTPARMLSAAQITQIQHHLRYDMPLHPDWVTKIGPPSGVSLNSDRPDLGSLDLQRSGGMVDFDGDGRREIAVWNPPAVVGATGTFRILRSRQNHTAATEWSLAFGTVGDVPIPADYNGDGCTDLAVWRTSGIAGTDATNTMGYFVYCESTGAPNCGQPSCTSPKVAQFGLRSDVPIYDARFGGTVAEIAVFRPSDGRVYWRAHVAGGSNDGYPGPSVSKPFGGARYGAVPLVGDYDWDGRNDPALYTPNSGSFEILRSGSSWSLLARTVPIALRPQDSDNSGTWKSAIDRAGGFPLEGAGILNLAVPALYYPHSGRFYFNPDFVSGGTWYTCQLGSHDWFPVGSIDRDADWRTDWVVFGRDDPITYWRLEFKNSASWPSTCPDTIHRSVYFPTIAGQRARVFGAWDVTGDAKVDVIIIDPDTMTFHVVRSDNDYASLNSYTLGTHRSVPL